MKRSINQVSTEQEDLQVQLLSPKGKVPTRGSTEAAGYDLYSSQDAVVPAHNRLLVSTDIAIKVPFGTYGRIAPRSGLATKNSIDIGGGVIDKNYRGPVGINLINHSDLPFQVRQGDRIPQLILEKIKTPETTLVINLDKTGRGSKGFGSTGIAGISVQDKPVHGERLFFKA